MSSYTSSQLKKELIDYIVWNGIVGVNTNQNIAYKNGFPMSAWWDTPGTGCNLPQCSNNCTTTFVEEDTITKN